MSNGYLECTVAELSQALDKLYAGWFNSSWTVYWVTWAWLNLLYAELIVAAQFLPRLGKASYCFCHLCYRFLTTKGTSDLQYVLIQQYIDTVNKYRDTILHLEYHDTQNTQ